MKILFYLVSLLILVPLSGAPAEDKVLDTKFIMVSSYLILASVFDAESTFSAVRNGAHEANPIMKPFVKRGRLATYGYLLASDASFIYLSYQMKKSSNKDLRKAWWVGPAIIGSGHTVAGGLNLRFAW
jgi:hypothetical protein